MMGTAHLTINEARNQLVVPVETVLYDGEQAYVYVVKPAVRCGETSRSGLALGKSSGDRRFGRGMPVIRRGQHQVKNGMLVEVR